MIKNEIKEYLKRESRSITWLAQKIGISKSHLSKWLKTDDYPMAQNNIERIKEIIYARK